MGSRCFCTERREQRQRGKEKATAEAHVRDEGPRGSLEAPSRNYVGVGEGRQESSVVLRLFAGAITWSDLCPEPATVVPFTDGEDEKADL